MKSNLNTIFTKKEKDIPTGWATGKIEDLINKFGLFCDGDWVESKDQNPNGNTRLIQLADIGNGYFRNKSSRYLTEEKAKELNCTIIKSGDLLIVRLGDPLGKSCIFPGDEKNSVTAVDICIVRTGKNIIPHKWLMYFINSPPFRKAIRSLQSGTTRKRISRKNLAKINFPIPPLPEQHRIVAKIEELFTKLDAGIKALKQAEAQLKRYRQSVLKAAVEGKLTEEWREQHKDELEPADKLLERVIKERREKWESEQLKKYKSKGIEPPKNWKDKYKEPTPPDTTNLLELPEGWVWAELGTICEDVLQYNPQQKPNNKFIYLDIASIDNTKNKITSPKYYMGKDAPSRARQLVKSGDILFSTVRTYLKNIAIVNDVYDGQIASTGFFIIRPLIVKNKYLFYLSYFNDFVNQLSKIQRGTNYPAIRKSDMYNQLIPIPPIKEQIKIIEETERLFSITTEMESSIEYELKRAHSLRQSILKQAFEGKLVPQDPNDEPASVLLERIKSEKAKAKKSKKMELL